MDGTRLIKLALGVLGSAALGFGLVACGGSGGSEDAQLSIWCPIWETGDSATYTRTEVVSGVTTESEINTVVTARSAGSVSVTDGLAAKTFAIVAGTYVPESEMGTVVYEANSRVAYSSTDYQSDTPLCPPPGVGATYEYETWVPGPFVGSGELVDGSLVVTEAVDGAVSVPAGDYTGRSVHLEGLTGTLSGVDRDYVAGLGIVKEVDYSATTRTTITRALSGYDEAAPALGTVTNPIVVAAGSIYEHFGVLSYLSHIGTGTLHFKLSGLDASADYTLSLTEMSADANLYLYADAAFESSVCSSTNLDASDEACVAAPTLDGELFVRVDGSLSGEGTYFALIGAKGD